MSGGDGCGGAVVYRPGNRMRDLVAKGRRLRWLGARTIIVGGFTGCGCEARFIELATRIGGTCLSISVSRPDELSGMFAAVGALAGGGLEAMRSQARGEQALALVRQLEGFKR